MLTFQDFERADKEGGREQFVLKALREYQSSEMYLTALAADLYDKQRNKTINDYVQTIFTLTGNQVEDFTASNAKLTSNFFHRLNVQRCTYSLGNGVSFTEDVTEEVDKEGKTVTVDQTKKKLGKKFDTDLFVICYNALIHGVAYGLHDKKRLKGFKATNYFPFPDERDCRPRAGVWWHQIDKDKPVYITVYEEDGYTEYKSPNADLTEMEEVAAKRSYFVKHSKAPADAQETVTEENYSAFPIITMWGSRRHQSTLVGMQQKIDAFDLIDSGFANDMTDVSQIFTIIENCAGMSDEELCRVRDRMKTLHIISADTSDGAKIHTETHEPPHEATEARLNSLRSEIYEDFGGLDVHSVSADSTNDHLEAAYQPMDEEADDFEYNIIEFVQAILATIGIEDTPEFKRNRISNHKEQTEMLVMVREDLDRKTFLRKLPFIAPDEVASIIAAVDAESESRYTTEPEDEPEETEEIVV